MLTKQQELYAERLRKEEIEGRQKNVFKADLKKYETTLKDIRNNYTEENLAKLKKGYFCDTDEIDYDITKKKIRTNKLFGL